MLAPFQAGANHAWCGITDANATAAAGFGAAAGFLAADDFAGAAASCFLAMPLAASSRWVAAPTVRCALALEDLAMASTASLLDWTREEVQMPVLGLTDRPGAAASLAV